MLEDSVQETIIGYQDCSKLIITSWEVDLSQRGNILCLVLFIKLYGSVSV